MNAKLLIIASIVALCMVPIVISEESEGISVTYYVDDEPILVTHNPDVEIPGNPIKEGYTFIGWSYRGEIINPFTFDFGTDRYQSYNFYAVFEKDIPDVQTMSSNTALIASIIIVASIILVAICIIRKYY